MNSKWDTPAWPPATEGAGGGATPATGTNLDRIRRELHRGGTTHQGSNDSTSSRSNENSNNSNSSSSIRSPSKWHARQSGAGDVLTTLLRRRGSSDEVMYEEEEEEADDGGADDDENAEYGRSVGVEEDEEYGRGSHQHDVGKSAIHQGGSYYSDESIPLSLFIVDGVLTAAADEGDMYESDTRPRKSPLTASLSSSPTAKSSASSGKTQVPSSSRAKNPWEAPVIDTKGRLVDQPLTFHARIKSSGYGQQAAPKMAPRKPGKIALPLPVQRSSSAGRAGGAGGAATEGTRQAGTGAAPQPGVRLRSYPQDCHPMSQHQPHNDYPLPAAGGSLAPVFGISFSPDASALAVCNSESAVCTVKLPISRFRGDGHCFLGHNGRVTSASFSHSGQRVLSSGEDGQVMLWSCKAAAGAPKDTPLVVISHCLHQPTHSATAASTAASAGGGGKYSSSIATSFQPLSEREKQSRNRPFGTAINAARFFYVDKFILLSLKASVLMYSYASDRETPDPASAASRGASSLRRGTLTSIDELKKQQSCGRYQRVARWCLDPAQSVTALAAVNSVQSPLAFCATSDRRLHVLDAAVGCVARSTDCGHDRPVHCIALPCPSVYASLPMDCYGMFATAATDNAVALWDLRDPAVVMRYTGHTNRHCEHVQCALSPCLRFLAVGSEDRAARVVDIRTGKELVRLAGHRDVVTGVAFNPLFPQLATASFDGKVKFFLDPYTATDDPTVLGKV